ncbi:MAG: efflux RND transporter periplasmic adaptor subunit [Calothrix sp. MO_167.B42]|nr:efflux RND transporter periplasmic adaptor subunit [Calothrix sp. MO_167.B42]
MESPEIQHDSEDNLPRKSLQLPRKQPRLWLFLALLMLTGGGVGIWHFLNPATSEAPAQAQMPPKKVKLSQVQVGKISDSSEFIGTLESRRSVTLQPRIQGQVTKIFVKSGDIVKQGEAIIQVDSREQQASVNSVRAAADGARSQLENAKATLSSLEADRLSNIADVRLNEREYQRSTTLEAEGAISRQTKDQDANKLATARASLRAIEARIKAQKATVSQAEKTLKQSQANIQEQKVQLQYYRITAPFTGIVGDIPVKEGDFVNTSSPLASITQNRPLEVEISVPIEKQRELRKGIPVEILDTGGQVLASSRVSFIAPSASNNTQTILVKALLNNSQGRLRADQLVRARVIWNQRPGVLVPTFAVSRIAGENFVYVAQTKESPQGNTETIATQKQVKLGSITGNNYQVLSGLEPGDKIVVSGILNLRNGDRILSSE